MHSHQRLDTETQHHLARRVFLGRAACGIGGAALATLLGGRAGRAAEAVTTRGVLNPLHYAPKAKRVIFLTMAGGPSHLETLDNKPKLAEMHGQPMPESFTKGQPIAQLQGAQLKCFAPQHPFKKFGQSGQEISEIFPQIGTIADEICIIRSLRTEAINHDPAHTFMNTGTTISGRPSMGSWLTYGLGAETENLPGFVVLGSSGKYGQSQPIASRQWSAGFLPSRFQGVELRGKGEPVLYVNRPAGLSAGQQGDVVGAVEQLNKIEDAAIADAEIATRIAQYELAFKMQSSVPELVDLSNEPKAALRPTACWRDGWPSGACGSFSFITATGTITAASRTRSPASRPKLTEPARPWSPTSRTGACFKTP